MLVYHHSSPHHNALSSPNGLERCTFEYAENGTGTDRHGYDFLKECDQNPWAMGKAFIKMKKLSEKKGNPHIQKWLQAFSSHPDFDARIQQMRQRAEKDGYVVE